MTRAPETIDEARALPEVPSDYWLEHHEVEQPDGSRMIYDTVRPLVECSLRDASIIWFLDSDGRGMRVVATAEGWAKTRSVI